MAIVRTDIPTTAKLCEDTILALVAAYPQLVRTELLTTTAFGRPIRTLVIGNGARKVIYTAFYVPYCDGLFFSHCVFGVFGL